MFELTLTVIFALFLDKVFGEAPRFHPLIGFGKLALKLERKLNQGKSRRVKGIVALIVLILPFVLLSIFICYILADDWISQTVFSAFILYTAIGWQSLKQHILPIYDALTARDLPAARQAVSMIVSRDTQNLSAEQTAAAACESALENGADAIFSAIFWFLIAGAPGVVAYRLSNTLDAMWGYKNERFLSFGWAAARLDDCLNYLPARLTALSYALTGHTKSALMAWRQQGRQWKSPNAGPVMASGAGAINVLLGGQASYHGSDQARPLLGLSTSPKASADALLDALKLIDRSLLLWCLVIFSIEFSLVYLARS